MSNLRKTQLARSHRLVRPRETVEVGVQLNLLTVNELNVKDQKLSTSGWLTVQWKDERFNWIPAMHDDIEYFFGIQTEVWRPEIIIDNSIESLGVLGNNDLLFRVKYTSEVRWEIPIIFVTHCEVDVTFFPFDTQDCEIELTSWAYSKSELILEHLGTAVNLEDLRENGEWEIVSSRVLKHELTEPHETFTQLDFHLTLRRRPSFYVLHTILPVVLSSYLSMTVFLLPADSGEKVSYSLTVLLALAVLLTLISEMMPSTSLHVSILGIYLGSILVIATLSVLMTVLVLRLYLKPETERKPPFLLKLVYLCSIILCWDKTCCGGNRHSGRLHKTDNGRSPHFRTVSVIGENGSGKLKRTLSVEPDKRIATWKEMSEILDRIFFWLFFLIVTIVTIVLFMWLSMKRNSNVYSH
ncbi:hypothetical protein ScPMuIL_017217 [Solemya velum]